MQKIIICFGAAALLAGCAHKIPVQQGNILTQAQVERLKPGMEKRQVQFLLGTPVLNDPFHQDRWDYRYSYKPGSESKSARQYGLTVWFEGERMLRYEVQGEIPAEVPLVPANVE